MSSPPRLIYGVQHMSKVVDLGKYRRQKEKERETQPWTPLDDEMISLMCMEDLDALIAFLEDFTFDQGLVKYEETKEDKKQNHLRLVTEEDNGND
jgi:hypothetical protein